MAYSSDAPANSGNPRRRGTIILVLTGIMVVILYILFSGKEESAPKKTKQADTVKYVRTQTFNPGTVPIIIESYGRVVSARTVDISSEVQGKILSGNVKLKAGSTFSKGALLFRIDNTDALFSLSARKAGFINLMASSMPDLRVAYPDTFEKWQAFYDAIDLEKPLPELPEVSTKEKTFLASRNVLGEYYNIKGEEVRLAKYNVYAPFAGTISSVQVEPGSNTNPGARVCTIIETQALEVVVPVPTAEINLVTEGDNILLTTPSGDSLMGVVDRISGLVTQSTQSVDIYARLNGGSSSLYDGMYFDALIYTGDAGGASLVPRRALLNESSVYLLNDSTLKEHKIRIIKLNQSTAVVSGIPLDVPVVVEPVSVVNNSYRYVSID